MFFDAPAGNRLVFSDPHGGLLATPLVQPVDRRIEVLPTAE